MFSLADITAYTNRHPLCQLSFTGEELMKWSRLVTLPAIVRVKCSTDAEPSQHSQTVPIIVKEKHAAPPKPQLKIFPAVIRKSGTVQMTCEVPQSQSASLCLFYLSGVEAAPYSDTSCQISLTGAQILQWTRQRSPLEAKVGCYYRIGASPKEHTESSHSDLATVTVLDRLQKPNITVSQHSSISVICGIPKHYGEATSCQLYIRDEPQHYLTTKTRKNKSGDLFCEFTVNKDDLFRRLQSLRSREVSCDYTVDTVSPRSDSYIFTGKISHNTQ
ncbi:hypothetical protein ACEWY4_013856 [Coilia grayii]|uniref:Ig-like domain-containing protein n=1 Tax=Coilia grayii TaxID=363190 RepID=A0ABD1JY00_9TELE